MCLQLTNLLERRDFNICPRKTIIKSKRKDDDFKLLLLVCYHICMKGLQKKQYIFPVGHLSLKQEVLFCRNGNKFLLLLL